MRALIIGGTGPTGHFIVNGLRERGYAVAMLHSGRHERDEIPDDVEHVHTDAFDPEAVRAALGDRRFDVSIVTYGRLRALAEVLVGRTERFISIGGVPAYRGFMQPTLFDPPGSPVPIPEDAPLVTSPSDDGKGFRIVQTERAVFAHHPEASHFRYPYVYGPYQLMPREWCIVRRILDRRPFIVLPDGGLTLHHHGYTENLAHAVLLAVDRPEAAAGEIFNCGDEEVATLHQVVTHVARALEAELEIISLPWEIAAPARPLVAMPWTTHRVLDLTKLKQLLGYRDKVPVAQGIAITARWLAAHRPEPGGTEEMVLQDPFDYAAEDALVKTWRELVAALPEIRFESEPGYTLSYSGPGGRIGSKPFESD